jgi:clan AA aspartic protease
MSSTIVEPKPGADIGRVFVPVTVENGDDVRLAASGRLSGDQVRRVSMEALVDTGATLLCLPTSIVQQLGLKFDRTRQARTAAGPRTMSIYSGARLEVQGRACNVEVMELPDDSEPLLGQIPLETLDWWVDVVNRRLVGNPEHGGQWMIDL